MELLRALGFLIESPTPEHAAVADALLLPPVPAVSGHSEEIEFQRYPYASVYLGAEGMLGGDARDRIAGFWKALGMQLPEEPDHLSTLLSLAAALELEESAESEDAQRALLTQARTTLLWEHVLSWCVPYLTAFHRCTEPFYRAWANLLGEALKEAAERSELPTYLPAALVSAGPLEDPRVDGGGQDFLAALLAPARSGLVILRSDLARAAGEAGLAIRAGERRYVLSAFFGQDPHGTLVWLGSFADEWTRRLEPWAWTGAIGGWWVQRARATATLVRALAEDRALGDLARAR